MATRFEHVTPEFFLTSRNFIAFLPLAPAPAPSRSTTKSSRMPPARGRSKSFSAFFQIQHHVTLKFSNQSRDEPQYKICLHKNAVPSEWCDLCIFTAFKKCKPPNLPYWRIFKLNSHTYRTNILSKAAGSGKPQVKSSERGVPFTVPSASCFFNCFWQLLGQV